MRMHILSGGRLRMRRAVYYPDAAREALMDLPVSCVLLKHPRGLVLFDTGCHPGVLADPAARWGSWARSIAPIFTAQEAVVSQLPLAGVAAADVDVVVCSHLHFDHCGCNAFFPRATVVAQASEIAAATAEDAPAQGYVSVEWKLPTPIQSIQGEHDLFDDGRIVLLPMPGHTPGMMAARVALERDGTFVLASDAVAVRAHLDERYTPRNTRDVAQALASIESIARMRDRGATVLFGHDLEQWAMLRTGAAFYE